MLELIIRATAVITLSAMAWWLFQAVPVSLNATVLSEFPIILPLLAIFILLCAVSFVHEWLKRHYTHQ